MSRRRAGFQVPPEMRQAFAGLGAELSRISGQVAAAGVAQLLDEVGKLTGEVDQRVKHGAEQARRVAQGEAYRRRGDR